MRCRMTNSEVVGYHQEHTSFSSLQKITGIFSFFFSVHTRFCLLLWEEACLPLFLWTARNTPWLMFTKPFSLREWQMVETFPSYYTTLTQSGTKYPTGWIREKVRLRKALCVHVKGPCCFSSVKKATAEKTSSELITAWSTLTTQLQASSTRAMERIIK